MTSKTHRHLKDTPAMLPNDPSCPHHWPFPSEAYVIPEDTPEFIAAKLKDQAKKEKNQKKERSK